MKMRVQKWGNSLALRIPKSFAVEAKLGEDTPVELTMVDGGLVIRAITEQPLSLNELLRGVNKENLHGEWDTAAVGKEIW